MPPTPPKASVIKATILSEVIPEWTATLRAHPLNPLSLMSLLDSQLRTGIANPVLARSNIVVGSGFDGVEARSFLEAGSAVATSGATTRNSSTSSNGTLTSRECAMLAQSVSRNSWLRMYHVASRAATLRLGRLTDEAMDSSTGMVFNFSRPSRTMQGFMTSSSSQGMKTPRLRRYAPPKEPPYSKIPPYLGDVIRFNSGANIMRATAPQTLAPGNAPTALTIFGI